MNLPCYDCNSENSREYGKSFVGSDPCYMLINLCDSCAAKRGSDYHLTDDNLPVLKSQYADLDYSGMHQFTDYEDLDDQFGSFEVFQACDYYAESGCYENELDPYGWYWWSCFPGCLPDGDPVGPFDTSAEAYHDAQGY